MLNSNFCKMFKNRLKLRKVATIVVCLVVTTMFAACDNKDGDEDDSGNGKTDQQFVGQWSYESWTWSNGIQITTRRDYYFFADGSFMQFYVGGNEEKKEGKYTVSDGKVYFANVKYYSADADLAIENISKYGRDYLKHEFNYGPVDFNGWISEYKFGSDKDGDYLQIFTGSGSYDPSEIWKLDEINSFFRKVK